MKFHFYTSIFCLLVSCSLNEPYLEGRYIGLSIETHFYYDFYIDHTFRLQYNGHAGNDTITGYYTLKNSIVYLTYIDKSGMPSQLLYKQKENCLRDKYNNFYCRNTNKLNEKIWANQLFEDSISNRLKLLPFVQTVFEAMNTNDDMQPHFSLENIQTIENMEYYIFSLNVWGKVKGVTNRISKKKYFINLFYKYTS